MEPNNYQQFLKKSVKIILTFQNGSIISYFGVLISVDDDSLLIDDRKAGHMLIRKKDISQIMEVL